MTRRNHYHEPPRRYRQRPYRARQSGSVGGMIAAAALIGTTAGAGWTFSTPEQKAVALSAAKDVAVGTGMMRERAPQDGDHWRGCDDARAAGTAPIYRGEPGYREGMDGDSDGIACEPYR